MEKKIIMSLMLVLVILAVASFAGMTGLVTNKDNAIRVGIITDLTGPAAYWGESTRVGAELAAMELRGEGYDIELIFEDYQLDSKKALNSAQKLVNLGDVDAIYVEFNPAAISVGSFVEDKDLLFVYDAAVVSPLGNNPNAYKTYLDYREGCRQVSEKFKQDGIEKIGVLKVNLEFGELCLEGVREVYPEVVIESYNLGDKDFRTQMLKFSDEDVGAVVNVGFEGDTLNTLKIIKEQGLDIKYGTVEDTVTQGVKDLYSDELAGGYSFGFADVYSEFRDKIQDEDLGTEYGAALAYTHIKQMVRTIDKCSKDYECVVGEMDNSPRDLTIGFNGFNKHVAELDMEITEY